VAGDLSEPAISDRIALETLEQLGGKLGLLVNSAASFVERKAIDTDEDTFDDVFAINVRAPLMLSRELSRQLRESNGCIVNISDRGAVETWPRHAAHGASKAALESLTAALAHDLAPDVAVFALQLGTVLPPENATEEMLAFLEKRGDMTPPETVVSTILELVDGTLADSGSVISI
jgi:pteridine reductase